MSNIKRAALAALLTLGSLPGSAFAAESSLQLIIGGEAYDGPPKFEVTFDGTVVGEGTVDAAIDTAKVGRFADATDRSDYVESYTFPIPEKIFSPNGDVRIRFLNEAYGGDGSNRDRNLYVASVAVNGRAVTLSGLSTQGTTAAVKNETLGEFLVLKDGNSEGISRPPAGGWPAPDAANAVAPAKAPIAVPATPSEVAKAPVPAPAATEENEEVEVASTGAIAPAVKSDVDEQPSTQLAALTEPVPATRPAVADEHTGAAKAAAATDSEVASCTRQVLYNVVGFNENSNDLTPTLKERLDQIIADLGEARCSVLITGYSSRAGAFDTNALFAIERAQNVLAYLKQAGLRFQHVAATGGGATDQFGPSLAANRRVVITVTP